jgi:hypothetical protein
MPEHVSADVLGNLGNAGFRSQSWRADLSPANARPQGVANAATAGAGASFDPAPSELPHVPKTNQRPPGRDLKARGLEATKCRDFNLLTLARAPPQRLAGMPAGKRLTCP